MKIGELKEYKGYVGSICLDEGVYHGKLLRIPDLVTYESDGVIGLYDEFKLAVDDFIEFRNEISAHERGISKPKKRRKERD